MAQRFFSSLRRILECLMIDKKVYVALAFAYDRREYSSDILFSQNTMRDMRYKDEERNKNRKH